MRYLSEIDVSATIRRKHIAGPGTAVRVHVQRLDVSADIREFDPVLSDDERRRAMRFHHDVDRRRFVITRASLRHLLGAALEAAPRTISIDTTGYGRPVLAGRHATSNIQFNVSHSGDLAVIAITHDRRIGVDVEVLRSLPDMNDLVDQNFSPREREEYAQLPLHMQQRGFFNCWTRKEALVKAWGCGLHYPLDQFDVSLTPGKPAQLYRLGSVPGGQCGWQLYDFVPLPGAIAAIGMEQDSPGSKMQLEFTHS